MFLACALPAFGAGIAEDCTKTQSPRRRLFFTAVSAGLAGWWVGAVITRTDIPGLDWVVAFPLGALLVTMFVVAGVANAVNIIDGFNGLASMCVVIMLIGLAYVAFAVGDHLIASLALAGIGAVLGFFVWNFPAGLVFLGDGGAYFLGFYLAELAILLLHRNPGVSPMFPLLLCLYPVFETLFSIYRRKWLRGAPVGMPDAAHLHSLIYRRFMRWAVGANGTAQADAAQFDDVAVPVAAVFAVGAAGGDVVRQHRHPGRLHRPVRRRLRVAVLAHRALQVAALAAVQAHPIASRG